MGRLGDCLNCDLYDLNDCHDYVCGGLIGIKGLSESQIRRSSIALIIHSLDPTAWF